MSEVEQDEPINAIHFTIYGSPIAQPRHRVGGRGGGKKGRYIAGQVKTINGVKIKRRHDVYAWKEAIARECHKHAVPMLWEGPIRLQYAFWMKRPNDHYRTGKHAGKLKAWAIENYTYHTCTPDEDNLAKALKDAITDSGSIWLDDCQVCRGGRRDTNWVEEGAEPRVAVWIESL